MVETFWGGGFGGKGGLGDGSSDVLCRVGERLDGAELASLGCARPDPAAGPTTSGCCGDVHRTVGPQPQCTLPARRSCLREDEAATWQLFPFSSPREAENLMLM